MTERVARVCAYVTRGRGESTELLVFDHRDHPEALTQVPAGGVDRGETPDQALARELEEEAGLTDVEIVGLVSDRHWNSLCYHVRAERETRDAWEHVVHGEDEDAGLVFAYRWVRLADRPQLWGHDDPVLDLIEVS